MILIYNIGFVRREIIERKWEIKLEHITVKWIDLTEIARYSSSSSYSLVFSELNPLDMYHKSFGWRSGILTEANIRIYNLSCGNYIWIWSSLKNHIWLIEMLCKSFGTELIGSRIQAFCDLGWQFGMRRASLRVWIV